MSRLIDADEAITRIDAKLNEIPTFTESEYGIMGYRNACVAFKRMLDSIPTVNGWIPCSERLPETGQYVLVSMDMNYVATATFQGDYWESNFDLDWEEVLAWQPLPNPYCSMGENYGFPSKEEADLWMDSKPVGKEEI